MKTEYTIGGKIVVRPNVVLAPMAGVTDSPFRRLIKEIGGVGLIVTEFVSVEGLTRGNMRTHRMMSFLEEERPISIQIFGHDVERMRTAAEVVEETGADILDINCGCPARRVVHGGGGSNLLRELPHLEKILRTIRKTVSMPMTVKIRIGYYDRDINAVEVAKLIEACGGDQIAVHGRTKEQAYKGKADWDVIAAVKRAVSIPVVGSGDVVTVEGALARLRDTGVDGVMIGRGAIANPFIFRETEAALHGREIPLPTPDEKYHVLARYYDLIKDDLPEKAIPGKLKQLCNYFTKGLPGGADFRLSLLRAGSVAEMLERIEAYFKSESVRASAPVALLPDAPSEDWSCDMYAEG